MTSSRRCAGQKKKRNQLESVQRSLPLNLPVRSVSIPQFFTHDPSVFWTLTLRFKTADVPERFPLGRILFSTTPVQMCDKDRIDLRLHHLSKHPRRLHSNWSTTCAIIKTETILATASSHASHVFEIGYRIFENTHVLFQPSLNLINFLKINKQSINLRYKWKFNQLRKYKGLYYRRNIKSLHFAAQEFSWEMAAEKCREHHMTLPRLRDEESTQEFVLNIQNGYLPPMYAMFVGLVTKVM